MSNKSFIWDCIQNQSQLINGNRMSACVPLSRWNLPWKKKARVNRQLTRFSSLEIEPLLYSNSFYKNVTLPIWGHNKIIAKGILYIAGEFSPRLTSRFIFDYMTHLNANTNTRTDNSLREIFYGSTRITLSTGYDLGYKAGDRPRPFANFQSRRACPKDKLS